MRLVAESELRESIELSPLPQYVSAANSALDTATLAIEADLMTKLDRVTQTDHFRPYRNEPGFVLKLKRGFLIDGSVVVDYALNPGSWAAGATEAVTSSCVIDYEKGYVLFGGVLTEASLAYSLPGSVIQVTYTAGFVASEADASVYDPLTVPRWLKDLALLRGQINISNHPAVKGTETLLDVSHLREQYAAIMAGRARYKPASVLPVM